MLWELAHPVLYALAAHRNMVFTSWFSHFPQSFADLLYEPIFYCGHSLTLLSSLCWLTLALVSTTSARSGPQNVCECELTGGRLCNRGASQWAVQLWLRRCTGQHAHPLRWPRRQRQCRIKQFLNERTRVDLLPWYPHIYSRCLLSYTQWRHSLHQAMKFLICYLTIRPYFRKSRDDKLPGEWGWTCCSSPWCEAQWSESDWGSTVVSPSSVPRSFPREPFFVFVFFYLL